MVLVLAGAFFVAVLAADALRFLGAGFVAGSSLGFAALEGAALRAGAFDLAVVFDTVASGPFFAADLRLTGAFFGASSVFLLGAGRVRAVEVLAFSLETLAFGAAFLRERFLGAGSGAESSSDFRVGALRTPALRFRVGEFSSSFLATGVGSVCETCASSELSSFVRVGALRLRPLRRDDFFSGRSSLSSVLTSVDASIVSAFPFSSVPSSRFLLRPPRRPRRRRRLRPPSSSVSERLEVSEFDDDLFSTSSSSPSSFLGFGRRLDFWRAS